MNLHRYEPHQIRFLDLTELSGWRVKVYGIAATGDQPSTTLVDAAKAIAQDRLPHPAVTDDRYGVAVLIVHEARTGNFVLLDWWCGENMLHHKVFSSSLDSPTQLQETTDGIAACVWELYVLGFEREAWIDTVLANPLGPDVEEYVSCHFDTAV